MASSALNPTPFFLLSLSSIQENSFCYVSKRHSSWALYLWGAHAPRLRLFPRIFSPVVSSHHHELLVSDVLLVRQHVWPVHHVVTATCTDTYSVQRLGVLSLGVVVRVLKGLYLVELILPVEVRADVVTIADLFPFAYLVI